MNADEMPVSHYIIRATGGPFELMKDTRKFPIVPGKPHIFRKSIWRAFIPMRSHLADAYAALIHEIESETLPVDDPRWRERTVTMPRAPKEKAPGV